MTPNSLLEELKRLDALVANTPHLAWRANECVHCRYEWQLKRTLLSNLPAILEALEKAERLDAHIANGDIYVKIGGRTNDDPEPQL